VSLVDEAAKSDGSMGAVVEVTVDQSAGERLTDRVQRLKALLKSQAPCSQVSLDDSGVVTIDFGKLDDQCQFAGRTFAGIVRISFDKMGDGPDAATHLEWDGLTDGVHVLDGSTDATFTTDSGATVSAKNDLSLANLDADIVHDVLGQSTIARLDPAKRILDGGWSVDGDRSVSVDLTPSDDSDATKDWQMSFQGLQILPDDAGPHAGLARLTTPDGRVFSVLFGRIDADTISATVSGPNGQTRTFAVSVDDSNPQPM